MIGKCRVHATRHFVDTGETGDSFGDIGKGARSGTLAKAELAMMEKLIPLLKKQVGGRDLSGLAVYE